jgi:hypothetical protein
MKELNQLAADIVYDWEHRERYGSPEGYTEGDELLSFETRPSANKVQAEFDAIMDYLKKVVEQCHFRFLALDERLAEEEARWTEIETRLMHGKALHEAAERSSMSDV